MSDNTEYKLSGADEGDELGESRRPCLIMIKGDFIGQVYELSTDVTMLGRGDDVQLILSDVSISRRHAMIVNRQGAFYVSDLGSTNGTLVNRQPIHTATRLKEGDKISIGSVTFKFSFQDEDDTTYHTMLRNMALKDGLTRIFNRRYFLDTIEKEFDYSRRMDAGLAVIIFDIDYFKEINDTYGHAAGDHLLKGMTQIIEQEARGYDVFARYGGDEFVFLMRGASRDAAGSFAERVRRAVEYQVFEYDNVQLQITISVGVSWYGGGDMVSSPDELIKIADDHLYVSKNAGRNRISVAS